MATYWPQSASGLNVVTYPAGPTVAGTLVTSSASTNTKGSYTQLIASTSFTTNRIELSSTANAASGNGMAALIDLATGAGGSESVVISNLAADIGEAGELIFTADFPLAVASGTRVAARFQANVGSRTVRLNVTAIAAGGMPGMSSFTTYGADTSDSGATGVDPGGTTNTKGSYTEITSSSSALAQWMMAVIAFRGNAQPLSFSWAVDIATGAGGAETVLYSDLRVCEREVLTFRMGYTGRMQGFLTYVPASTRLAARASCTTNDATDRLIDVELIAGTAPTEPAGGGGKLPIAQWQPIEVF